MEGRERKCVNCKFNSVMMAHKVTLSERGVLHNVVHTTTTSVISSLLSLQVGIIKLKLVEISHVDFQQVLMEYMKRSI
jgi:hypothetical protein